MTGYDPNVDYTAAIQRTLEDGSAYAMQVGAIYEQQRNLKIQDLGLELEQTDYFQRYTTAAEILQAMEEAQRQEEEPAYTEEDLDLLSRGHLRRGGLHLDSRLGAAHGGQRGAQPGEQPLLPRYHLRRDLPARPVRPHLGRLHPQDPRRPHH